MRVEPGIDVDFVFAASPSSSLSQWPSMRVEPGIDVDFVFAAIRGDTPRLQYNGADVNIYGATSLHCAASGGSMDKLKTIESQLSEAQHSVGKSLNGEESEAEVQMNNKVTGDSMDSTAVTRRLEEELQKWDALIERLHEEDERLFDRLTEKAISAVSTQVPSPSAKVSTTTSNDTSRNDNNVKGRQAELPALNTDKNEGAITLVKSGVEKGKTTPAGKYLTSALDDFDPEQYDSLAAVSDGANKLLMLVLAAVIKAGASREHEILAEIRDAVFGFIRKMEPKRVMDTMLVSRVRILYIRSLLARSPELQSIKVPPVDRFLEKANSGRSRSSSRGSRYDSGVKNALIEEHIQGFKVNLKPEKKSKLSSVVLKICGIDQETWRQHVTGGKLREITEEAKYFAIGNRALAALFGHTPAGELQRQIRNWLAESFDFLSVADDTIGGATGQLELLSTAIIDGLMAGLGAAQPPNTDALGQLLSEYAKRVYNSQLQHLKDIASTLATEIAEDSTQVAKLRSALESVDHKRKKILQQMRSDRKLLTLGDTGSPIRNPSTVNEDTRLASLVSLDGLLKQVKIIVRQASAGAVSESKKIPMLSLIEELSSRMPSLLAIDHPCALKHIAEASKAVEEGYTPLEIAELPAWLHGDGWPVVMAASGSQGSGKVTSIRSNRGSRQSTSNKDQMNQKAEGPEKEDENDEKLESVPEVSGPLIGRTKQDTDEYKMDMYYIPTFRDLGKIEVDLPNTATHKVRLHGAFGVLPYDKSNGLSEDEVEKLFDEAEVDLIPDLDKIMPAKVLKIVSGDDRLHQVFKHAQYMRWWPIKKYFEELVVGCGGQKCSELQQILKNLIKRQSADEKGYYNVPITKLHNKLNEKFGYYSVQIVMDQSLDRNLLYGARAILDHELKGRKNYFYHQTRVRGTSRSVKNPNLISFRFPEPWQKRGKAKDCTGMTDEQWAIANSEATE